MSKTKINIRQKASSKLAILALLGLVCLLLLGKFVGNITSLFRPQTVSSQKQYSWDGKSDVNLAVQGTDDVAVMSYDPTGSVTILKVPNDTYFNLAQGRGQWRVGSIYQLGQSDNPPDGSELLRDSLARLVGLPMDGFLVMKTDTPLDQIITSWRQNPLRILGYGRIIKTDMSPLEALRVFKAMSGVRGDKVTYLDIERSNITDSELLADSTRVLGVNSVNLDLFVRQNMADTNIEQEDVEVGIYNATDHPGLGQIAARIIINMGGNVIFVTNSDNLLQSSQVVTSSKSETAQRLKEVFAPSCLSHSCLSSDPNVQGSRAAINLLVGEDFFKRE